MDFLGFSCLVRHYCPNCQDERHLSLRIAFALLEQGCDLQRIAFMSPESLLSGEAFASSCLLVTEIALFVGLSKGK